MLLRNDLLQYTHPAPRTLRVLWIAPEQSHAYVFDVAARSADVELVALPLLQADLRAGRARVLAADPYLMVVSQELLPPKHLQLRARAWRIVEALVAQEPGIYEARLRGQLVAQATVDHGVSHPTIYRYLRRYWQRGQTPNALLPDYCNSGGRGKVRQASAGVKRGRPRKNDAGDGPGLNADEEIRRTFRVAIARYAAGHAKFSRLGAYQQMLADFFSGRRVDADSGRVLAAQDAPAAVLPTFGQFNYWLDHDDDRPPEVARRSAAATARGLPPQGLQPAGAGPPSTPARTPTPAWGPAPTVAGSLLPTAVPAPASTWTWCAPKCSWSRAPTASRPSAGRWSTWRSTPSATWWPGFTSAWAPPAGSTPCWRWPTAAPTNSATASSSAAASRPRSGPAATCRTRCPPTPP
ncbi:hypothetical protein [Duganella sp. BJB1802]|uniref:hypothetical protein n=1 Tax=Duganella sp. BJB1802 TaxID=2744575 RepID=UPI001E3E8AC5|nr:hypothetical protein [Duganella sp. BJB1802]